MKQSRIALYSLLIALCSLLSAPMAFAEDICFTPEAASKLVVEIEQCRNMAEQNVLLEQALRNCNSQIEICKEQQEQNNKICDEMVKAVKPTIFSRMRDFFIDAGIVGIVIVIGVLVL